VSGKQLRPLLIFANAKDPKYPDVPISKDAGLDAAFIHFRAMFVKAGTSPEIVRRLTDAVGKAAASSAYASALEAEGALKDSVVSAESASAFIDAWLREAQRIKGAK
jgi:tripartite-type tricarboxylate transporter receptor subunit TctC